MFILEIVTMTQYRGARCRRVSPVRSIEPRRVERGIRSQEHLGKKVLFVLHALTPHLQQVTRATPLQVAVTSNTAERLITSKPPRSKMLVEMRCRQAGAAGLPL